MTSSKSSIVSEVKVKMFNASSRQELEYLAVKILGCKSPHVSFDKQTKETRVEIPEFSVLISLKTAAKKKESKCCKMAFDALTDLIRKQCPISQPNVEQEIQGQSLNEKPILEPEIEGQSSNDKLILEPEIKIETALFEPIKPRKLVQDPLEQLEQALKRDYNQTEIKPEPLELVEPKLASKKSPVVVTTKSPPLETEKKGAVLNIHPGEGSGKRRDTSKRTKITNDMPPLENTDPPERPSIKRTAEALILRNRNGKERTDRRRSNECSSCGCSCEGNNMEYFYIPGPVWCYVEGPYGPMWIALPPWPPFSYWDEFAGSGFPDAS